MHLNPSPLRWSTRSEVLIYVLTHQNILGHSAAVSQAAPSAKAAVAHLQLGHVAVHEALRKSFVLHRIFLSKD